MGAREVLTLKSDSKLRVRRDDMQQRSPDRLKLWLLRLHGQRLKSPGRQDAPFVVLAACQLQSQPELNEPHSFSPMCLPFIYLFTIMMAYYYMKMFPVFVLSGLNILFYLFI